MRLFAEKLWRSTPRRRLVLGFLVAFGVIGSVAIFWSISGGIFPARGAACNACSWNCLGLSPHCGDGIVNGTEQCDGQNQDFAKLCGAGKTLATATTADIGCNADGDCPAGTACASLCAPDAPERRWRRSCGANLDLTTTEDDATACKWSAWNCAAAGTCGDGVKNTGEDCDDGNDSNTDACVRVPLQGGALACRNAVCGDGFTRAGVEQCDDGQKNGHACAPEYGRACIYCSTACKAVSVSGGYCGDRVVQDASFQPPGPEACEPLNLGSSLGGWACVSTKHHLRSWGLLSVADGHPWPPVAPFQDPADTFCSAADCTRSCSDPDTYICFNGGTAADTDSDGLRDVCDSDKDNDGVPGTIDCDDLKADTHPSYTVPAWTEVGPDGQIVEHPTVEIAPAGEACDGKDNDCNTLIDDSPPVDMVFAIDISGSMQSTIAALANGIHAFVDEFKNSPHKFGYVLFGQGSGELLADPYGTQNGRYCQASDPSKCFDTKVLPTDVAVLQPKLKEIADNFYSGGGIEPDWAVTYELAGTNGGRYGMGGTIWRATAKPFIVLMTDEKVSDGSNNLSVKPPKDATTPVTEADVASRITQCAIGSCAGQPGAQVSFFIMTNSDFYADWDLIIPQSEKDYRFIPISSQTETVKTNLRTKVFREVCSAPTD